MTDAYPILKNGDRVVLKIGGPVMLVLNVRERTFQQGGDEIIAVECVWFDRSHRLQSNTFNAAHLFRYHLLLEVSPDGDIHP